MKRRFTAYILLLLAALFALSAFSYADTDHPISLSIACDPACELSEAGKISWLEFRISNQSNSEYTLRNASLSGDILPTAAPLEGEITIPAHENREFRLENLAISEERFDVPLTFMLSWTEYSYAADDILHLNPIKTEHSTFNTITIERFVLPEAGMSLAVDSLYCMEGEKIVARLTLTNSSNFDMTNIIVEEAAAEGVIIPDKTILMANSSEVFTYELPMGVENVILQPTISYTVREREVSVKYESELTVEYLKVALEIEAQLLGSSELGTSFVVTIRNLGTHSMTNVVLWDEINTQLCEPFELGLSWETINLTIPTASQTNYNRMAKFHVTALDCRNGSYSEYNEETHEIKPYIQASQVKIELEVALVNPYVNDEGKLIATLNFIIKNNSVVPINNVELWVLQQNVDEPLKSYPNLGTGSTKYSCEMEVGGLYELSFVLYAADAAGNRYSSSLIRIDLAQLSGVREPTSPPAIEPNDQGSVEESILTKLTEALRSGLIVVCVIVGLCMGVVCVLFYLENRAAKRLPQDEAESAKETEAYFTRTGEQHTLRKQAVTQVGYKPPAKLLYSKEGSQRFAPLSVGVPVKLDPPRESAPKPASVRVINTKYEPKVQTFIPNEFIRVASPKVEP